MNGDIKISVVGLSIKTAPIEDLEYFQIHRKDFNNFLKIFASQIGIEGVVFVSTCNRFEIYFTHSSTLKPFKVVEDFFKEVFQKDITKKKKLFYAYSDSKAVEHLFKVISGLDSLVLGEYQIQGQVKDAYSIACQVKTVDKILHRLFHAAFRCGKLVRNSTSIGKGRLSVSGMASEIVLNAINDNTTVAIIGVNENTKILADELAKVNFRNIIFVNRTLHKAQALAEQYFCRAKPLSELENVLNQSEIVFTSTGSPVPIISSKDVNDSFKEHKKPRIILDLAIPRDVEVDGLIEDIEYYDIEKLKTHLDKQQQIKLEELPLCEKIIKNEVDSFLAWQESHEEEIFEPFAERFERIRKEVLEEYISQINPSDLEKVDKITRQLIHRTKSIFVNILKEREAQKHQSK
ncbi:glutamyl-tRNA reductase [Bacteroidetes/Chlorobi group bacterium Naka2016]|jgi:glutamyl-tRNA reductase|nr:MAG: glutamyl-tRNA reductase [Bacteroidetes/Chlorobi group bacterium Naka2016]